MPIEEFTHSHWHSKLKKVKTPGETEITHYRVHGDPQNEDLKTSGEDTFKLPLQAQGISRFWKLSSSWQMRHSTIWISSSSSSTPPCSSTSFISIEVEGLGMWRQEPPPDDFGTSAPCSVWNDSGEMRRSTHKTIWSPITILDQKKPWSPKTINEPI